MPTSSNNGPRRTLLLTGASRGIGHATVIRFSSAGWRVAPAQFEYWHDRPFRLHDRIEFRRAAPDQPWSKTRLYP